MTTKISNTVVDLTSVDPIAQYPIFNSDKIQSIAVSSDTSSLAQNYTFTYDTLLNEWKYSQAFINSNFATGPNGAVQFNAGGMAFGGTGTFTYLNNVLYLNSNSGYLNVNTGIINNLAFTNASGNYLTSTYITGVNYLAFNIGSGNYMWFNTGYFNNLAFNNGSGNYLTINSLTGGTGYFNNLLFNTSSGNYLTVNSLTGGTGYFNNITAGSGFFNLLFMNSGFQPSPSISSTITIYPYNNNDCGINIYGTYTGINSNRSTVGINISPVFQTPNTSAVIDFKGLYVQPVFNPLTGILGSMFGLDVRPNFSTPASSTLISAYGMFTSPTFSSNKGTITSAYTNFIGAGTSGSGTITNGYSLYINNPNYSTNRYTAYMASKVLIGTTDTPVNNNFSSMPLQVNTTSSNQGLVVQGTQTTGTTCNVFTAMNNGAGAYNTIVQNGDAGIFYGGIASTDRAGFCISPWLSNTSGMRLDNTGNAYFPLGVGIGTTPPSSAGLLLPTSGGTPTNLNYYEEYSASFTFQTNGGGGTTTSVTVKFVRIGGIVRIAVPAISITSGTLVNVILSTTTVPSRFIPVIDTQTNIALTMSNGVLASGVIWVGGTGSIFGVGNIIIGYQETAVGFPSGTATSGTFQACGCTYLIT